MGKVRMLSTPWITCLWPGLTDLWVRGRWQGLVWAIGFTLLLNAALITKGVWPDLWGAMMRNGIWYVVLAVWLLSAILTGIKLASGAWNQANLSVESLFQAAQKEYLRGEWFQAEAILLKLLAASPKDAEAWLLLATLQRHCKRYDEAQQTLAQLQRLDAAGAWWFEIHRERELLAERSEAERSESEEMELAEHNAPSISDNDDQSKESGTPSLSDAA